MEQSVEKIIERNLLEVFNGRDADSRRAAIDELWNKDGVFIDPDGVHEGVEKIDAVVELLFTRFEGYVFSARGPGQSVHGVPNPPLLRGSHQAGCTPLRFAPYSALSAVTTSTCDARAAGVSDATIAATTSTAAAPTIGTTPGI